MAHDEREDTKLALRALAQEPKSYLLEVLCAASRTPVLTVREAHFTTNGLRARVRYAHDDAHEYELTLTPIRREPRKEPKQ